MLNGRLMAGEYESGARKKERIEDNQDDKRSGRVSLAKTRSPLLASGLLSLFNWYFSVQKPQPNEQRNQGRSFCSNQDLRSEWNDLKPL